MSHVIAIILFDFEPLIGNNCCKTMEFFQYFQIFMQKNLKKKSRKEKSSRDSQLNEVSFRLT